MRVFLFISYIYKIIYTYLFGFDFINKYLLLKKILYIKYIYELYISLIFILIILNISIELYYKKK